MAHTISTIITNNASNTLPKMNCNSIPVGVDNTTGIYYTIDVDSSGRLSTKTVEGFNIPVYDYVSRGWTAGTFTEVWTFKTGGSGGTTVGIITIVYDDVLQSNIVTVTKT